MPKSKSKGIFKELWYNVGGGNTEDKIAEIMAQAHIKRGKSELRESMMQTNTIVYLLILLVLFILSMEFLPSFLVIPVIMSFLVIKVLLAMKKQDLDLKRAIKENIVVVLLTGLFVFLAILNIFDKSYLKILK